MKKIVMTFIMLIASLITNVSAFAETTSGYSVSPIFSEHQTTEIENFFDIRWTPLATENFSLRVTNNTDTEQTYDIQINKARTNKNGIIDYSDVSPEDHAISYKLTEMIQLPKEVTAAPNSSKEVEGTLTFPEKDFNGILMAGIHVSEKKEENNQSSVSNTVAYNIPFVVRGNIDERPTPSLELSDLKVNKFSSDTYSVDVTLANIRTNLLKEVQFIAEIKDVNGQIITTQNSKLDITPETSFVYPIKLPSDIKEGKYTMILHVQHDDKEKWDFTKGFNLSSNEAKEIRNTTMETTTNWMMYAIMALIIVFIVIVGVYIFLRRKNK